ncbi:MAG: hypothetical protein D6708_01450 [Candidatus Dadabacteria bacterium]|nr:MAG: hypothetical protein D6708_01450 [Candidatus Dadabacteria bacterium]
MHFAGAKKQGATEAEIRQVLAMAMMVGAARVRNFVTETLGVGLKPGEPGE